MTEEKRLYAIVLRLATVQRGALPADHGDFVRSALFNLLKHGDSPLAQRLHDENAGKPYTITSIQGGKRGQDGALNFGEGDRADWRFCLMIQPAFEALLQKYLLNNTLSYIRIGTVHFAIVDAFVSHTAHPDSGHISLSELYDGWQYPVETMPDRLILDFQSPTTFSKGQDKQTREYRFQSNPDARIVFSSLRKRWNKLGGTPVGDEFDVWVAENIEWEIIRLQGHKIRMKKRQVPAFTGQVAYQHYGQDRNWLPFFHLLADLTFWTGIGYQTTYGMGQVRRLPIEP